MDVLFRNATRSVLPFSEKSKQAFAKSRCNFSAKRKPCVYDRRAKIGCGILMKIGAAIAIIPARFNSTRFPGKLLAEIDGKTLIEHVYRRVEQATLVGGVRVATDHQRIADAVRRFGGTAIMTREDHSCGTDRLAEAVQNLDP